MKHLFSRFILPALFVLCGGLTGCSEDKTDPQQNPQPQPPKEEATASIKTVETASGSNAVVLTTENITEYAYLCEVKADKEAPSAAVIFATGTTGKCDADGETRIEIKEVLEPGTAYVVYIALKTTANEYYPNVLEADLTPASFDESELFQVLQELPDGYVVRINVPQSTKDANNVLRYVCRNVVVDNYFKYEDFFSMLTNGGFYLDKSTTITMDTEHIVMRDENGEPVIDPDTGDVVTIADPMVPGEPLYMSIGEYGWGESNIGWGEGWYIAQFDMERWRADQGLSTETGGLSTRAGATLVLSGEEDYWTGAYGKYRFSTAKPDTMTASVKVELTDMRPNDATITLRPEEGVDRYCVLVLPHAEYMDAQETLFDNDEGMWQWFTTSLICQYLFVAPSAVDAIQFNLSDLFYASALNPGIPFHIMITAMKDRDREKDGMIQSFKHETFELPARTKPAPEIIVTPLPEKCTPYDIFFNIKAPNRDAYLVRTLLNYEREWLAMLNKGNSYSSMTAAYGVVMDPEMVAKINSDEGLEISYKSRPDAISILAVQAENDEGLGNNLDVEGSPAVARLRSLPLPELPRVDSDLFERLNGDWTATATVEHTDLKTGEKKTMEMSTKVTISNGLTYDDQLKDWVYYLYPNQSKEWVDALYDDFKAESDNFNNNLTRRNMLLCMGFDFDSNKMGYLTPALPFELFTSTTYSSTNNAGLFYDFGPKWYLQVRADGSVVVPINYEDYAPLSDWYDDATYYLVGWDKDDKEVIMRNYDTASADRDAYFPVTVSEDRNTITINSMVLGDKTYYMTPVALGFNTSTGAPYAQSIGTIVRSSIVLTRGYTEPAATSAASSKQIKYVPGSSLNPKRPQGRSIFVSEQPAPRRIELEKAPTREERNARMKAYVESRYGRK